MQRLTPKTAMEALHGLKNKTFVELFKHGSLAVEIYQLKGTDQEKPHTRDEVYVVVSGKGYFVNGGERRPFEPGEVLFVPAGWCTGSRDSVRISRPGCSSMVLRVERGVNS